MAAAQDTLRQRKMPQGELQTSSEKQLAAHSEQPKPAELPQAATLHPFHVVTLTLLFVTVLAGSIWSLLFSTAAETSFRTRLPASALGKGARELAAASLNLTAPALPYFADKRNILNQVFVKKAWAWTTLAVVGHIAVARKRVNPIRPALRWAVATTAWILFTTWAFGPSINHRFLLLTGAKCTSPDFLDAAGKASTANPELCLPTANQGQTPAGVRPYWEGGHDISGHTFILVHAIFLIVTTISPTFAPHANPTSAQLYVATAGLALVGLWWWMLLMTSVWFHSPPEKLSGLFVGILGWTSYWVVLG